MRPRERIAKRGFSLLAEKPRCVAHASFTLPVSGYETGGQRCEGLSTRRSRENCRANLYARFYFYGYTIIPVKYEKLGTDVIAFRRESIEECRAARKRGEARQSGRQSGVQDYNLSRTRLNSLERE